MAKQRSYLDFKLELRDLDQTTQSFKVAVLPSDRGVGETQTAIAVPLNYDELEYPLNDLDRKQIDQGDLFTLGEGLANRLLPSGQVRDLFQQAVKQAGLDGGVRLRMIIREPRLAQLPWEFSYLQMHQGEKSRNHFLVLNPQISMVRHEALPEIPAPLTAADPQRLHMVVATANAAGYRPLKLDRERRVIEAALSNFSLEGVSIEWQPFLEDTTVGELTTALANGADMFHFAGHGTFTDQNIDPETHIPKGEGHIVLLEDKATSTPYLMPASELARYAQQAGVRLAVLGACKTARRDGVSAWTGIAPALIERGIPAVVAMQYEVKDPHALAFSKSFYSSLVSGVSLDEAVALARQAMLGVSEDNVEWGVPVVYMRSSDGIIFPQLAERQTEAAAQIRQLIQQTIDLIESGGEVIGVESDRTPDGGFQVVQKVRTVKGKLTGWKVNTL